MNTNESIDKYARLHARLIAEAEAERPEFSPRLHDRIMRSICEASPPPARGIARRRAALRLWMVGSAAAVVVLVFWLPRGLNYDSTEDSLASVAPPAADQLTALVDRTFAGSQWAYLDHDARLAVGMVLSHLPFELP